MINDNKILEKYLIDPSAAAMRGRRMDVKKERYKTSNKHAARRTQASVADGGEHP